LVRFYGALGAGPWSWAPHWSLELGLEFGWGSLELSVEFAGRGNLHLDHICGVRSFIGFLLRKLSFLSKKPLRMRRHTKKYLYIFLYAADRVESLWRREKKW